MKYAAEIMEELKHLTPEQLLQALNYARSMIAQTEEVTNADHPSSAESGQRSPL